MSKLSPGTIVDRYRLEEVIGAGAMGDVVRAVDVDLKRPVALKILSQRHRDNEELRARFVREGRAVAAISHPNVVQVFTTGTFDERPYIAMELLRGVDLGTVVRERGIMSSRDTARSGHDAARGLEAAARAGLIHRDVKPSNLVLTEEGIVKVTDFGLAKPLDPKAEPALTAMGVVVGTPDYIAPEQARGDAIDERVDIYALGGTMYFLLTGSPPFRTGKDSEDKYLKVVARHLKDPPPNAQQKNRHADPELSELICTMMAKRPVDRPSHEELCDQLAAIATRLQGAKPRPSKSVAIPDAAPTPFVGGRDRLPEEIRRSQEVTAAAPATERSTWLVWMSVFCVGLFLVGVYLTVFRDGEAAPNATPSMEDPSRVKEPAPATTTQDVKPAPAPEGMFLVTAGGHDVYCQAEAVGKSVYAKAFPETGRSRPRSRDRSPVVKVSFDFAEAYAKTIGARLPTPEEWDACRRHEKFVAPGELYEWVDNGTRGAQAERQVRGARGAAVRQPGPHDDVTFRVVKAP